MKLDRRDLRALAIVANGNQIRRLSDARYLVDTQSRDGSYYVAWRNGRWTCDCKDSLSGRTCKHVKSITWALLLPRILEANAPTVQGPDSAGSEGLDSLIMSDGRPISTHKAIAFYKQVLSQMGDTKSVYPPRPSRPRFVKNRHSEHP